MKVFPLHCYLLYNKHEIFIFYYPFNSEQILYYLIFDFLFISFWSSFLLHLLTKYIF